MRIDKYLWAVRYFKTRNIASEACKKGMVTVNDVKAKSSREVYPMDKIIVRKNQVNYQFTVLDLPKSRMAAKLIDIYRKDTTPIEEIERAKLVMSSKSFYREKGTGRPTKKDRRDLDDYAEDFETYDE
jgi:ribosome-associated heat shock protein Hsp15